MSVPTETIKPAPSRRPARRAWSHEESAALQARRATAPDNAQNPRLGRHCDCSTRAFRAERGKPSLLLAHTVCCHSARLSQTERCRGTDRAPTMPALPRAVRFRGSQTQLDLRFVQAQPRRKPVRRSSRAKGSSVMRVNSRATAVGSAWHAAFRSSDCAQMNCP